MFSDQDILLLLFLMNRNLLKNQMTMKYLFLIPFFLLFYFSIQAQTLHLLIVTGGHEYDSLEFFQMFDAMEDVEYEHLVQPEANKRIAKNQAQDFDLIVFYDLWQEIDENEKLAYLKMAEQGRPMLFLHQTIMSYQKWPDYEKMLGAKFVLKDRRVPVEEISTKESDVWEYCSVENYNLVTTGFRELRFFDEIYGNVMISENIFPLLRIRHPNSMDFVAWENRYRNSRILYIQPGHDKRTFDDENYRKLLKQSVHYLAGKPK